MTPIVSVIMPVYNGSAYIGKAIESALLQGVPLEIIVIDDGSTDNLDDVLKKYADTDVIRVIHNKHNIGVARSRNRGVRAAKGEYIAFLDCDDWWEPGKLKSTASFDEKNRLRSLRDRSEACHSDGHSTEKFIRVKEHLTYRDLLVQNPINCSSVVIRKDVAAEFPMVHDECHEDYIMWLQILKKYRKACAINKPLLNYRLSNTGKSGSKLQSARMTFKVYRYMNFGVF